MQGPLNPSSQRPRQNAWLQRAPDELMSNSHNAVTLSVRRPPWGDDGTVAHSWHFVGVLCTLEAPATLRRFGSSYQTDHIELVGDFLPGKAARWPSCVPTSSRPTSKCSVLRASGHHSNPRFIHDRSIIFDDTPKTDMATQMHVATLALARATVRSL